MIFKNVLLGGAGERGRGRGGRQVVPRCGALCGGAGIAPGQGGGCSPQYGAAALPLLSAAAFPHSCLPGADAPLTGVMHGLDGVISFRWLLQLEGDRPGLTKKTWQTPGRY